MVSGSSSRKRLPTHVTRHGRLPSSVALLNKASNGGLSLALIDVAQDDIALLLEQVHMILRLLVGCAGTRLGAQLGTAVVLAD